MADIRREERLAQLASSPFWKDVKRVIEGEIEKSCDYDKAKAFEEFLGYQMTRRVWKDVLRQVEGAKDSLSFKGRE
ncbi:MAG TPA: hypothetical protein ENI13_00535 [candidate division CPR3 bacterium]|uniref:Uncharacterized protein n=1 Tax=candidate division CPR3 bacterium TaxID=2268181 RepID=A0A7C1NPS6_UNCC3|nr:hypothetical protein [candidate division CPR3 bacterium]